MSGGRMLLVGCGAMAGAMLARWLDRGLPPSDVTVVRPSGRAVAPGVEVLAALPEAGAFDTILIGVKPHMLGDVAPGLARLAGEGALVVSILAGVRLETLRAAFPRVAVARAMPNLPVRLGKGVVALHGDGGDRLETLMAPLGLTEWIADETLFDAVTALAGSGPAFLYRFVDALARGGAGLGLPDDQAARLALATVEGAALLAAGAELSPAALADRVASKGGSTRAGLNVLDADGALDRLVAGTLRAAEARNREMGLPG